MPKHEYQAVFIFTSRGVPLYDGSHKTYNPPYREDETSPRTSPPCSDEAEQTLLGSCHAKIVAGA